MKSHCIRTPWSGVTIRATYELPGFVLDLTMTPAFAQGSGDLPSRPSMPDTWTVTLPSPVSGRWTKRKVSSTRVPSGAETIRTRPLESFTEPLAPSCEITTVAAAASTRTSSQLRTVQNLLHSARSNRTNPSRPGWSWDLYGVLGVRSGGVEGVREGGVEEDVIA